VLIDLAGPLLGGLWLCVKRNVGGYIIGIFRLEPRTTGSCHGMIGAQYAKTKGRKPALWHQLASFLINWHLFGTTPNDAMP
jgi:hypothetical protein